MSTLWKRNLLSKTIVPACLRKEESQNSAWTSWCLANFLGGRQDPNKGSPHGDPAMHRAYTERKASIIWMQIPLQFHQGILCSQQMIPIGNSCRVSLRWRCNSGHLKKYFITSLTSYHSGKYRMTGNSGEYFSLVEQVPMPLPTWVSNPVLYCLKY